MNHHLVVISQVTTITIFIFYHFNYFHLSSQMVWYWMMMGPYVWTLLSNVHKSLSGQFDTRCVAKDLAVSPQYFFYIISHSEQCQCRIFGIQNPLASCLLFSVLMTTILNIELHKQATFRRSNKINLIVFPKRNMNSTFLNNIS